MKDFLKLLSRDCARKISKMNYEIDSMQPYFSLENPYNSELLLDGYMYNNSVLKFDSENLCVFIADVYFAQNNEFQGIAIKSNVGTVIAKKNHDSNKYKIETIYEN